MSRCLFLDYNIFNYLPHGTKCIHISSCYITLLTVDISSPANVVLSVFTMTWLNNGLNAVDDLEIGLHHQPESPQVGIYHSFVERVVGSLEQGHHPYRIMWDNLPLGNPATVNPYAAIKDGRAALFTFGIKRRLCCREIATISQDLDHLKELNIRGFQARQPGNVEVVEDLLTIQEECLGVVLSLWNHQVDVSRGTTGFTCGTIGPISVEYVVGVPGTGRWWYPGPHTELPAPLCGTGGGRRPPIDGPRSARVWLTPTEPSKCNGTSRCRPAVLQRQMVGILWKDEELSFLKYF